MPRACRPRRWTISRWTARADPKPYRPASGFALAACHERLSGRASTDGVLNRAALGRFGLGRDSVCAEQDALRSAQEGGKCRSSPVRPVNRWPVDHAAAALRRPVCCWSVAGGGSSPSSARSSRSWWRSRSLIDTRHHRSAVRIMVAKTSFIATPSSISQEITLVRRRSSTKDRSARLVVRTRMRCRTGTRWIASSASRSSVKQATAAGYSRR